MTLMLHCGGEEIDYNSLRLLPTPEPTKSHVPIPHASVVDMVKYSLGYFGHEVVEEHHAISHEGHRYFGVLTLHSQYGDYTDMVGLRNSSDKSFPIGISFGSRVFVCDNLAFNADTVIKRRHTANAKRDLPSIVAGVVEPLRAKRERQHAQFQRYQTRQLVDDEVDHLIMSLYRRGAINVTRIADVLAHYENPPFDWGDRTAWRLFNAVTYSLEGRVAENPRATTELHDVIDGVCEEVAA